MSRNRMPNGHSQFGERPQGKRAEYRPEASVVATGCRGNRSNNGEVAEWLKAHGRKNR